MACSASGAVKTTQKGHPKSVAADTDTTACPYLFLIQKLKANMRKYIEVLLGRKAVVFI